MKGPQRQTCASAVRAQPAIDRLLPACDPALDAVARAAGAYRPSRVERRNASCNASLPATGTPPPGGEGAVTATPDPRFVRAMLHYATVLTANGSGSTWAVVYVLSCFP